MPAELASLFEADRKDWMTKRQLQFLDPLMQWSEFPKTTNTHSIPLWGCSVDESFFAQFPQWRAFVEG
jgi:hypothetical protein